MQQVYKNYTADDFEVWKLLYERQMLNLPETACDEYLHGINNIYFSGNKIPDFNEVNKVLGKNTGWELHVVKSIIPERDFFPLIADKKFPATTWLRKKAQLD